MSKARDLANAGTALTTVSATELGYLDGVTSAVQTQINSKEATLPSQTGNSGKYLTTDGSTKSWGTVSQYSLPSMTGKAGKFLSTDGTVESWADAAKSTEIYDLTTSREWLATGFSAAGNYSMVTSTGTASVYVYNSSNALIHEFAITTSASANTISTAFTRLEAVGSTSLDLSITPVPAKITSTGGTLTLNTITGSGTYAAGTGTAAGGTSGYVAGQIAHVVLVGGSGGGGGGKAGGPPRGYNGGLGGVAYSTSPITLTGSYTLTVGNGGSGGAAAEPGQNGGNGGSTTGFGLTATGGTGGGGGYYGAPDLTGSSGGPSVIGSDTNIFKPTSTTKLSASVGIGGAYGNDNGTAGSAGRIFVLRWTP